MTESGCISPLRMANRSNRYQSFRPQRLQNQETVTARFLTIFSFHSRKIMAEIDPRLLQHNALTFGMIGFTSLYNLESFNIRKSDQLC